jgi:imidazolonepropionase-like amidohydrolase
MVRDGAALGLPQMIVDKVKEVEVAGMNAIAVAVEAGTRIGFGTDLIGPFHDRQSMELLLRCEVQDSWSVLRSATSENAALLNRAGELGVVKPGAIADLLAVDGDISRDLSCLQDQGRHIDMILQAGQITKLIMD